MASSAMDRWIVYLLDPKHINHLVFINHDGSERVEERCGGVLLPPGISKCTIYCIECDQPFVEGQHFVIEPFLPLMGPSGQKSHEVREPWEEDPEDWRR